MMEKCSIYLVRFKQREPIFIASIGYAEASDAACRLINTKDFLIPEGDEIVSVSLTNNSIYV